jgi:hypothetical protein
MEELFADMETLVGASIRAYIGLLGRGEKERSRRLFSDALELSAMVSGGPSDRSPGSAAGAARPFHACVALATLQSMMATLLVLKTTALWTRLSALDELLTCCVGVAERLESLTCRDGVRHGAGQGSAGTSHAADGARCSSSHETDAVRGCRRNNALPARPELSSQPAAAPVAE